MRRLILTLLLGFVSCFSIAQERPILDWKFFKNDRPAEGKYQAFTWTILSYKYNFIKSNQEQMNIRFVVTSKADTAQSYFESARRLKNDTLLLKHEQGHADIVYIYAVKLKQIFEQTPFYKSNYKTEIDGIFKVVFAKMRAEQARYDLETDHSKNRSEQKKWNDYFEETIKGFSSSQ